MKTSYSCYCYLLLYNFVRPWVVLSMSQQIFIVHSHLPLPLSLLTTSAGRITSARTALSGNAHSQSSDSIGQSSAHVISKSLGDGDDDDSAGGYDYDLVVIGGGSGGLAAAKEASRLGAKVAVLDFVKPSEHGTTWGLGGTCVNVGCIPKKLMHTAALIGELTHESESYGWNPGQIAPHSWKKLRENVQLHIKSLNFGYRSELKRENVTYLNKLGEFVDNHKIKCADKKGNVEEITADKFIIAVGGRPTRLSCPGAEYAITSDDLFSLENPPGKTCIVGAGYVALECAGFITGLRQDEVVVLSRSTPLRTFDKDIVEKVRAYMELAGTRILTGVTPKSIQKLPSGKLLVTYSTGVSEEFDTVLAAVGRYADTEKLGLDRVDVATNHHNGKIVCMDERTTAENIYAIGDVVDGAPELTPVAIQAGKLLARRLFSCSDEKMVYRNIATTVFTPLELGTVGLTEDEAIQMYGADAVDAYVSTFVPLEWTVMHKPPEITCIAKVIVDKTRDEKVVGMHIAAPNAGEIIQGFAVAFRKGLVYKDLLDTVGIHPTTAEEFTTISVSRSSGKSFDKGGC